MLQLSKISNGYLLESTDTKYFPTFESLLCEIATIMGEALYLDATRSETAELAATVPPEAGAANNVSREMPGISIVETEVLNDNIDASIEERKKYARIINETYECIARHFGQ